MALSYETYIGDGSTRIFTVTMPYVEKAHIQVTVDGTPVAFVWLNQTQVQTVATPAAGAQVVVGRDTPINTSVRQIKDAATLTADMLTENNLQLLYAMQEAYDTFASTVTIDTADGALNANGHVVKNVGTGTRDHHAVNLGQLGVYKTICVEAASSATASASSASASATEAAYSAEVASRAFGAGVIVRLNVSYPAIVGEAALWHPETVNYDPHGWYTKAVARFQPTIAGWYLCRLRLAITVGAGTLSGLQPLIVKNGPNNYIAAEYNSTNFAANSGVTYLNGTTDYISPYYSITGTGLSVSFAAVGWSNEFTAFRIG